MKSKKSVLFVEQYMPKTFKSVREYFGDIELILLRDIQHEKAEKHRTFKSADVVLYVDFTKGYKIAEALLPYQNTLIAVTARGEDGANKLREVIPHVPYLRTPTVDSLLWATDKYEMRKRFNIYDKKITPKFTKVKENTKAERDRVIAKIKFPMVVKPANLQESMLVAICYHEEELEKVLRNVFRRLKSEYKKFKRTQLPTIIAEEYMDGDMYSIDSYVNSRGKVFHCPMVRVKTGRNIGHDDFYNYLQITPTALKRESIEKAHVVAEMAVHALGLRSTTAHIELMKIDDDWKVIEVGARVGGFRDLLHELSCDIDHSLNDVLIRVPKNPIIPKKCKGFAAAMKWFAKSEGIILEMKGVKKIESLESFNSIVYNKKIGDRALFSKNGGKSILNIFLYNDDRAKLLADIRRVEQLVKIKIK
jgi:biotin carboxylase